MHVVSDYFRSELSRCLLFLVSDLLSYQIHLIFAHVLSVSPGFHDAQILPKDIFRAFLKNYLRVEDIAIVQVTYMHHRFWYCGYSVFL